MVYDDTYFNLELLVRLLSRDIIPLIREGGVLLHIAPMTSSRVLTGGLNRCGISIT
jgi:hypothetical protein